MKKLTLLQREIVDGQPIENGRLQITPQSEVINLQRCGFIITWQRPTVLTVTKDGVTQQVPIRDKTRIVQAGLLILTATFMLIGIIGSYQKRDK